MQYFPPPLIPKRNPLPPNLPPPPKPTPPRPLPASPPPPPPPPHPPPPPPHPPPHPRQPMILLHIPPLRPKHLHQRDRPQRRVHKTRQPRDRLPIHLRLPPQPSPEKIRRSPQHRRHRKRHRRQLPI